MKPALIVALDVPSPEAIIPIVDGLPREIGFYKVGLELYTAAGPAAIAPLLSTGRHVFLDLKLHDIPRTVARAVSAAAQLGVSLLTVHAGGGRAMLTAAAEAAAEAGDAAPKLIAVTTLTSLDQSDLLELGITRDITEHTHALGQLAIECGIDGLVCSPLEVGAFRRELGPEPILVTPGIRPAGADVGDQKRIATPRMAVEAGASHLVVGRPIIEAQDRAAAAQAILDEMKKA